MENNKTISNYSRPILNHHIVEIFDLPPEFLADMARVSKLVEKFAFENSFKILDRFDFQFQPRGMTLMYVLSSSHLVVHSWPENKYLHLDILRCDEYPKQGDNEALRSRAIRVFSTERVVVTSVVYPSVPKFDARIRTLFSALEALLELRSAQRIAEYDQLGRAVVEERGATFGKVVGIEEAIADHAANVAALKRAEDIVFNSQIQDDREYYTVVSQVEAGAIVTIISEEYGEETYGIDVSLGDEVRISTDSPFAKALQGRKKGDLVNVNDIDYQITDIRSSQDKQAIRDRVDRLVRQTIDETNEMLLEQPEISGLATEEKARKRRLRVSDLLDRIQMIEVVQDLYGIDIDDSKLLESKGELFKQDHFPVDGIRSNAGYIHIMGKIGVT